MSHTEIKAELYFASSYSMDIRDRSLFITWGGVGGFWGGSLDF